LSAFDLGTLPARSVVARRPPAAAVWACGSPHPSPVGPRPPASRHQATRRGPCAVAAAAHHHRVCEFVSHQSVSTSPARPATRRPSVKMKKRHRTLQSFFSPALTPVVCNVQPRSNLNSQPIVGTGTSNNQAQEISTEEATVEAVLNPT
jgi:hypothetical protein